MNGSTENRTSGASEQGGDRDVVLTWTTSHRMLPLVQRIIGDILRHRQSLERLLPEKARLDKQRRALAWPERARRYEIVDETYTFAQDSFSRTNVHVLTSVDYDKMPQTTKDMEPAATARSDGDYALSYIRREGQGRVFYEANGHNERVSAQRVRQWRTNAARGRSTLSEVEGDAEPSKSG